VEIIVPAVPRAAPKVPTRVKQVPEKRRSRGRPRKVVFLEDAVASEKNTIVDAESHTCPMVHSDGLFRITVCCDFNGGY